MIGAAAAYFPSRCRIDGAGGFLPGVPLDCLDMASQRQPQRRVADQPHVAASRKVTGVILSVKMTRFRRRKIIFEQGGIPMTKTMLVTILCCAYAAKQSSGKSSCTISSTNHSPDPGD
jgi:hypothetical protein